MFFAHRSQALSSRSDQCSYPSFARGQPLLLRLLRSLLLACPRSSSIPEDYLSLRREKGQWSSKLSKASVAVFAMSKSSPLPRYGILRLAVLGAPTLLVKVRAVALTLLVTVGVVALTSSPLLTLSRDFTPDLSHLSLSFSFLPPGAEPAGGPFRESLEAIARELQQSATPSAQPLLMALLRPPAELVPGTEPQLLLR